MKRLSLMALPALAITGIATGRDRITRKDAP